MYMDTDRGEHKVPKQATSEFLAFECRGLEALAQCLPDICFCLFPLSPYFSNNFQCTLCGGSQQLFRKNIQLTGR